MGSRTNQTKRVMLDSSAAPRKVATPPSSQANLNVTASASMHPISILSARYSYSEPRNYRRAHPVNEAERIRLFGLDFGLPVSRNEALSIDLTPRLFRFSFSSNFSDARRTQVSQTGSALPDYAPAFSIDRYHDPAYRFWLENWKPAGQL